MPRLARIPRHLRARWQRRSIRLRLTLSYGALFLASGAGLLTVTYFLVRHFTSGVFLRQSNAGGGSSVAMVSPATVPAQISGGGRKQLGHPTHGVVVARGAAPIPPAKARAQAHQLVAQARAYHAAELHHLLLYSGVALLVMAVVSVALGWLLAGRVLRPLRHMTTSVREISASSLDERLSLEGPHDELRELGDTFDALLGRLEGSFRAQHQFVANASHELRTPLARQKTIAQVALADDDATVASLRAAHERVLATGEQQERLIEALLTLSRGQAGSERREPFDLATLAEEVLLAREPETARRGIALRRRLRPAATAGDPRLVERLVANLVDNALRYNVAGGRVEVCTRQDGDRAEVTVSNTGPVVPPDRAEWILEPFTRCGGARTGEGLGLGLSIVRAVAEAHRADLAVRPRSGGGLEVRVAFPADVPGVEPTRAPAADGVTGAPALAGAGHRGGW